MSGDSAATHTHTQGEGMGEREGGRKGEGKVEGGRNCHSTSVPGLLQGSKYETFFSSLLVQ